MRRLTAVLVAGILPLGAAACGGGSESMEFACEGINPEFWEPVEEPWTDLLRANNPPADLEAINFPDSVMGEALCNVAVDANFASATHIMPIKGLGERCILIAIASSEAKSREILAACAPTNDA